MKFMKKDGNQIQENVILQIPKERFVYSKSLTIFKKINIVYYNGIIPLMDKSNFYENISYKNYEKESKVLYKERYGLWIFDKFPEK